MKEYFLPVLLQALGFVVIIIEIFIPSLGLLTLTALGIYAYSLYLVYTQISTFAGLVFTGVDIVFLPICIIIGMKILGASSLSLKRQLSKNEGVVSQDKALESFLNMEGKSITDLRPAGIAMIGSKRVDVVTDGEYLEKDTPVIVTGISGNRVVVEKF